MQEAGAQPRTLLAVLHRWRDEAVRAGRTITRIALAFEAGRDGFWLARWLEALYAADAAAHPARYIPGRRAGSSHDGRRKPAVSTSTRGSARRPLVGRAPWGDMPARNRLPRRLPGRHSPAPHPGRQDAEGAGRATPRRSC